MDNSHMFDELANRLNKVKRTDSGIHNSGEFISDNEKVEKAEEQADSGRDSDPAETQGTTKKGKILKGFRKMFRIRKKRKSMKLTDGNKAVSEPDINTCSGSSLREPLQGMKRSYTGMDSRYNDSPNENDFTSEDEENRTEEKKLSHKDGSSFIRSSLRKLKLRKKKSNNESPDTTPISIMKHDKVITANSPKKSTTPTLSNKMSTSTPKKNMSPTGDFSIATDEIYFSGSSETAKPMNFSKFAVDLNKDITSREPIIENSLAKDKIRIAPRGRKPPSKIHRPAETSKKSDHKTLAPLFKISEDGTVETAGNAESFEILKQLLPENTKEYIDETKPCVKEIAENIAIAEKALFELEKPSEEEVSENIAIAQKALFEIVDTPESEQPPNPINLFEDVVPTVQPISEQTIDSENLLMDVDENRVDRPKTVSLSDLTSTLGQLRKVNSDENKIGSNQNDSSEISNKYDLSNENKQYDRYRPLISHNISDIPDKTSPYYASKSMEDVSRLNKENKLRSDDAKDISPSVPSPPRKSSDLFREDLVKNINLKRSKETLQKSLSDIQRETTFAIITSQSNTQDPVIPYGGNKDSSNSPTGIPRKMQRNKKPRPQSVTVSAGDINVFLSRISSAKSSGDVSKVRDVPTPIKPLVLPPASPKKNKPKNEKRTSLDLSTFNTQEDNKILEKSRLLLKKTPKPQGYLPDETAAEKEEIVVANNELVVDEDSLLKSVKTTLRKVHTSDDDINSDKPIIQKSEQSAHVEKETSFDKEPIKQHRSPERYSAPVDSTTLSGFSNESDNKSQYNRMSLRKVEKTDNFLGNVTTEKTVSVNTSAKNISNAVTESNSTDNKSNVNKVDKPKPPVPVKPKSKPIIDKNFTFQSQDVKISDGHDEKKISPPSEAKRTYFRASEENENKVPDWIALAHKKQRDGDTDESMEISKEQAVKETDQGNIKRNKPQAPSPLPKPKTTSPTAPNIVKPPVNATRRVSSGKMFNAKTDLSKDSCMVCGRTAYVFERCEVNNKILHRSCAKCHICYRTLKLGDIFINDGKVCCRQHR